ncbi:hypothetical protein AN477_04110 [Alicyclobacillus ferrooxydans]|uniref:Uncharacterized protein n=2 Tax=Alicyclobacillus ferrooxydans TaxID=471514 RepID=A0A0P9F129_9BACL|nr:hypothetical protein AN477_04110 [Alicyclobacillus ferrooxydans]
MITRAHCLPLVGQRVVAQTRDGATHDGILHSVTNDGIYLRPMASRRAGLVNNTDGSPMADVLQNMPECSEDVHEVFFPFFFLPFFALAALGPWGWWWWANSS